MMRNAWMSFVLGGALVLGAGNARAQGEPGAGGPPPMGGPMELMGFEGMHGGKAVKGAPFSATSNSETTQTLQDGTVIHRTSTGSLSRDSEGRSRREITFNGVGPLAAEGGAHTMVSISDPVAGAHLMLNPEKKVAHKMTFHAHGGADANGDKADAFHQKMEAREQADIASGALKTESLGTQMMNGVNAQGTRTTRTIAAGKIGNDKAIQVVSERWYSPDLQMVVKSTRSDPRFGTTTFSLTNIQKAEPAAALFTVPSNYTVKEGDMGGGRRGGHRHGGPPPAGDVPPAPVSNN